MADPATVNLLINAGIAGVFAAFALVLTQKFLKHLEEQSTGWRQTNEKLADSIRNLTAAIEKLNGGSGGRK